MTTIPYTPTQVAALRSRMQLYGQKISPSQAWEVLRTTGDLDLAITALVMKPRPAWVEKKVGSVEKTTAA